MQVAVVEAHVYFKFVVEFGTLLQRHSTGPQATESQRRLAVIRHAEHLIYTYLVTTLLSIFISAYLLQTEAKRPLSLVFGRMRDCVN